MGAPRLTRGPKFLQEAHNALADYADAICPVSGTDITVTDSASGRGRPVNYTGPRGKGGQSGFLPFQVVAPNEPSESAIKVKIYKFSYLLRSLAADDFITIGGLDTDFEIAAGNRIWLELDISDYAVSEANISSDGAGDDWAVFSEPATWDGDGTYDDPFDQQKAYLLIAECKTPADGDPPGTTFSLGDTKVLVIPKLNTNLLLCNVLYDGRAMLYPMPFGAPSTI